MAAGPAGSTHADSPSFAEQTEDDLLIYDAAELLNEDEWLELELLADEITWR